MIITAFDLGTTFGWATNARVGLQMGSVELASKTEITEWSRSHLIRRKDPRFWRFRNEAMSIGRGSSVIVFEDVQFCNSRCQCQIWATWRAALWDVFAEEQLECVPTNVLKKWATGHGGGDKSQMAYAMKLANPDRFSLKPRRGALCRKRKNDLIFDVATNQWLDDNAVDAYWLYQWAQENVQR